MKPIYREQLLPEHQTLIIDGLNHNAYLTKELGKNNGSFSFVIENNFNQFEAGISGFNFYGCLHIDLLYIEKEARRKGYGSILGDVFV
jgi:GNAT superfamily N-acetyltransferase